MIDLYCERLGPGLLAEPLNTASNLAFFVAAVMAWRLARRLQALEPGITVLIALAVCVGTGSALFHTFATRWAQVLDVVPVLLFQVVFLGLYLRRSVRLSPAVSRILTAAFLAVCLLMLKAPPYLNGSLLYVPSLVVLSGLAIFHLRSHQPGPWLLAWASLVFGVSLGFRTLDLVLCPHVPRGTHDLWHLLNGCLLYLVMKTVILKRAASELKASRGL